MGEPVLDLINERYGVPGASTPPRTVDFTFALQFSKTAKEIIAEKDLGGITLTGLYSIDVKLQEEGDNRSDAPVEIPRELINETNLDEVKSRINEIATASINSGKTVKIYLNSVNLRLVLVSCSDCMLLVHISKPSYPLKIRGFSAKCSFVFSKCIFSQIHEFLKSIIVEYLSWQYENEHSKLEQYPDFLKLQFTPFQKFLDAERESIVNTKYRPKAEYSELIIQGGDDPSASGSGEDNAVTNEGRQKSEGKKEARAVIQFEGNVPRQLRESGNLVIVEWEETAEGKKGAQSRVIVEVENWDEDKQILVFTSLNAVKSLRKAGSTGTVILKENQTNVLRKMDALKRLKNPFLTPLQNLVDMMLRPEVFSSMETQEVMPFDVKISRENPETTAQYDALCKIDSTNDLVLVQGPPGSGKTTLIVELVKQCVSKGMRVLMCAATHIAVDNIIERLDNVHNINLQIVRIDRTDKHSPEVAKYLLRNLEQNWKHLMTAEPKQSASEGGQPTTEIAGLRSYFHQHEATQQRLLADMIINASNLICGTTSGVVGIYGRNNMINDFDVMVIDESSKATILEFLIPATHAKKWIIIGDQNQLPPYINDREVRIFFNTYFERKYSNDKDLEEQVIDEMNDFAKRKLSSMKGDDRIETSEDWEQCTDFRVQPFIKYLMQLFQRIYDGEHFITGKSYIKREWEDVMELFDNNRNLIRNFKDVIAILGSCYHYFFKRIEASRKVLLEYQYRMPDIIGRFISSTFYQGKLKNVEETKYHGLKIGMDLLMPGTIKDLPIFSFISTSAYDKPVRNEEMKVGNESYVNKLETALIVKIVEQINHTIEQKGINKLWLHPNHGQKQFNQKNPMEVGIIAFYAAQYHDVSSQVRRLPFVEYRDNDETNEHGLYFKKFPVKVKVSIVDKFQGQEMDIIIIPLSRSNEMAKIGFLKSRQRTNVAFSRPKHALFLVGDALFFGSLKQNIPNEGFNKLVEYCTRYKLFVELPVNPDILNSVVSAKRISTQKRINGQNGAPKPTQRNSKDVPPINVQKPTRGNNAAAPRDAGGPKVSKRQ